MKTILLAFFFLVAVVAILDLAVLFIEKVEVKRFGFALKALIFISILSYIVFFT